MFVFGCVIKAFSIDDSLITWFSDGQTTSNAEALPKDCESSGEAWWFVTNGYSQSLFKVAIDSNILPNELRS